MKIGFFQYAVFHKDRERNLEWISNAVRGHRFDLLVLPELFTCGYSFQTGAEVEVFGEAAAFDATVSFLRELAAAAGGHISGTVPEKADGRLYNTAILVNGSGLAGCQRKVHLPDYEKRFFSPGTELAVFDTGSAQIGMMSCFDCWFPAFGASLKQAGAQIVCNSASFGGDVTPRILPVRALENQLFVVSCNRIGTEYFEGIPETFCGQSQVISPDGKVLVCADHAEKLAFAEIALAEIGHPAFGSLICSDFPAEHRKYKILFEESGLPH